MLCYFKVIASQTRLSLLFCGRLPYGEGYWQE
jgi:hypothetical protein